MANAPPLIVKIPVAGACESSTRTIVTMRHHHIEIDEPEVRHGTDIGAMPLEILAAALVGCTNVIANRIAEEMQVTLHDLKIDVTLELDTNVLSGQQVGAAFPRVRLNISGRSNIACDDLGSLKEQLAARCPVSVLFRQAGSTVVENWCIKPL